MHDDHHAGVSLPIRRSITLACACSLVIALLMAAVSVAGLVCRRSIYPTDELVRAFAPTDVVTLVIGLPILLGSMWLARQGRIIGLLLWPGALLYALYHYVAYLFGVPFGVMFLPYLTLVTLNAYTLIGLVASIDGKPLQQRLARVVPERTSAGVLVALGLLCALRTIGVVVHARANLISISASEVAVLIADFLLAPALIVGGVMLWRRTAFGYVAGLGLLFQASTLFAGLIVFLLLQPLLTTAPFRGTDVVVVALMGLICFIPFALFARGVASSQARQPARCGRPLQGGQGGAS